MTETEFLTHVNHVFSQIEADVDNWFEQKDVDVDACRNGAVLTLIFNNSAQIVINSQSPLQEIWLASPAGAWHYRLEGQSWIDTKGEANLKNRLSELCSAMSGESLEVSI